MSTPDSTGSASDSSKGLAARAEDRFFTLDHVGAVRHIEGVDIQVVAAHVKAMLGERDAEFEEDTEQLRGRVVYTNIATIKSGSGLTVWVKATQFEGVGVLVDAKFFHSTEQSAEADEALSHFMAELEERVLARR